MWKPGQLVTINGNLYRISKYIGFNPYSDARVCAFCQKQNTRPPCVGRFDYPNILDVFSVAKCVLKMPIYCYPKRISPKR